MLEKERFLAIKKLANKINKDNKDFFKKISKLPADEAVQEKEEFIEEDELEQMGYLMEDENNAKRK